MRITVYDSEQNCQSIHFLKLQWTKLIVLPALLLVFNSMNAQQEEANVRRGFSMGMQIGQIQQDFHTGLNITSPYFAHDRVAVRMRGNLAYHQHLDGASTTWTPYFGASIGMVGVAGEIMGAIRCYGEGGVIGLIPSSEFSDEDLVTGGYGLFGFEFCFDGPVSYFTEIGGAGTGASADLIPGEPIYSNGLIINAGVRFTMR